MTKRPSIHGRPLDLQAYCDICGVIRNKGKHSRCSKMRQTLNRRRAHGQA